MKILLFLLCCFYASVICQFVDSSHDYPYGLFTSSIAEEAYVTYLYFESIKGGIQEDKIPLYYGIQSQDCRKFKSCITNNETMNELFSNL